ncbi:DMT family transporter [Candidatus Uabimicrobium amorphum]|uniref:Permease n=1 Tax=Uabimicrobium amorphum TaxID=2596890 RepID=A0A5S9IKC8_UABAM|nr:EamA family transporter [Candidatus Uabimicrobium amorphum]BBM82650.1 permease [Candidatus Uabimicrobium amorphum]
MLHIINKYRYHLYLHVIVFIWGFTGILGKLISLKSIPLVWYRMLIASAGLAFFAWFTNKKINIPNKMRILGVGFLIALHWILFFAAIKVSNVSVALVCMSSTPFFTAFLQPLLLRTRLVAYEVILSLFAIFGLYLIFEFEIQFMWGIIFAICSAFLAAVFTIINSRWIKKYAALSISLYEMLGGFLGITITMFAMLYYGSLESIPLPNVNDTVYLLVLGLICTSLAFLVSIEIMKEISPYTVTISVNMEPIYAILLAVAIFGESETMTPGFYLGASIIFATVFANIAIKYYTNLKKRSEIT